MRKFNKVAAVALAIALAASLVIPMSANAQTSDAGIRFRTAESTGFNPNPTDPTTPGYGDEWTLANAMGLNFGVRDINVLTAESYTFRTTDNADTPNAAVYTAPAGLQRTAYINILAGNDAVHSLTVRRSAFTNVDGGGYGLQNAQFRLINGAPLLVSANYDTKSVEATVVLDQIGVAANAVTDIGNFGEFFATFNGELTASRAVINANVYQSQLTWEFVSGDVGQVDPNA